MVLNSGDIFTGNDTSDDYEVLNRIGQGGFGDTYLVSRMSDGLEFVVNNVVSGTNSSVTTGNCCSEKESRKESKCESRKDSFRLSLAFA